MKMTLGRRQKLEKGSSDKMKQDAVDTNGALCGPWGFGALLPNVTRPMHYTDIGLSVN